MARIHSSLVLCLMGTLSVGSCCPRPLESEAEDRLFNGAFRVGRYTKRARPEPNLTLSQVLAEANEHFTYRGKPIHPRLINEFEPWLSDLNPVTIVVDVSASYDSNEYTTETYKSGDYLSIRTDEGQGEFGYTRIEKKKSGIHVLKTRFHGGGSASYGSELWVRFELGESMYPDGKPYDQLLMRLIRAK